MLGYGRNEFSKVLLGRPRFLEGRRSLGAPQTFTPENQMKQFTVFRKAFTVLLAFAGLHANAAFVIDSLDGDITQNEINNFVSTIAARNPATTNVGNAMAIHGTEPEGMWRMYEATGNVSVLNHFIRWM